MLGRARAPSNAEFDGVFLDAVTSGRAKSPPSPKLPIRLRWRALNAHERKPLPNYVLQQTGPTGIRLIAPHPVYPGRHRERILESRPAPELGIWDATGQGVKVESKRGDPRNV